MELSAGSFQLSAMDWSPLALASPAGAAGTDAGAAAAGLVVAEASAAGPAPVALRALTPLRLDETIPIQRSSNSIGNIRIPNLTPETRTSQRATRCVSGQRLRGGSGFRSGGAGY